MEWVKKNLGFVISLAVAVVLVGVGVFYLLGTKTEADGVEAELSAKNGQLDELIKRPVFPDAANIQLAKDEEARVSSFIKEARKHFTELAKPEGLDTAGFKSHLEATITELLQEADRAGVKLPDKGTAPSFGFTFDDQRKQLQLQASTLAPLTVQLGDIKTISQILFDAKVPSLVSFKRAPVGTNETTGAHLLTKKITTNSALGAVTYPYEVVFQGFSPELAAVLTGLIESPDAFIVKSLNVERGNLEVAPNPAAAVPITGPANPYGMDPNLARRYGISRGPAAPQVAAPAPVNRPGEVVLEEKPLRVTLGIELIKLLPQETAKPARPAPAPAQAAN